MLSEEHQERIADLIPIGLEREEYVELALMLLDEADILLDVPYRGTIERIVEAAFEDANERRCERTDEIRWSS